MAIISYTQILIVEGNKEKADAAVTALSSYVPEDRLVIASSGKEAIKKLEVEKYAAIFLDVDLPDTTGIALADFLTNEYRGLPYVFMSEEKNMAFECYEHSPADFLLLPLDPVRLMKTFIKLGKETYANGLKIAVETEQGMALIRTNNILYVEKSSRRNILHTVDGQEYHLNYSTLIMQVLLDGYGFFRCHQSYMISLEHIEALKASEVGNTYCAVMTGNVEVPVSRGNYKELKTMLLKGARMII